MLVSLAISAPVAHAQIGTSTITGRITDATSATVPSVAVTVVQRGTNFTFNTTTNYEGLLYRVLSLNPGMYQISAEASGFKKWVRDEVELRTGRHARGGLRPSGRRLGGIG